MEVQDVEIDRLACPNSPRIQVHLGRAQAKCYATGVGQPCLLPLILHFYCTSACKRHMILQLTAVDRVD